MATSFMNLLFPKKGRSSLGGDRDEQAALGTEESCRGETELMNEVMDGMSGTDILGDETFNPEQHEQMKKASAKLEALHQAGKKASPSNIKKALSYGEDSLGSYAAQILGGDIIPVEKGIQFMSSGEPVDNSGLDPWLYKLNPTYWVASKRKKQFIDTEKKKWKENAAIQEKLAKQREELTAAERSVQAATAAQAAAAQAAATEEQLKSIQSQLEGAFVGSFVGHENRMTISSIVKNALRKTGMSKRAAAIIGKIRSNQLLNVQDINEALMISSFVGRLKVVHGDIVGSDDFAGAMCAAAVSGKIEIAKKHAERHCKAAEAFGVKIASGQKLNDAERKLLADLLNQEKQLQKFTRALVSGKAFAGCPQAKTLTQGAFVGAAKAMSAKDKKVLKVIITLARAGNPQAKEALAVLKQTGSIMGGDFIGSSWKKTLKYTGLAATAPLWAAPYAAYKGGKWAKGKIFGKKGKSAQQIRIARLKAANKRIIAAQALERARDADSEQEQQVAQAMADAATAEANAADAEAETKEAASQAETAEFAPAAPAEPADEGTTQGSLETSGENMSADSIGKFLWWGKGKSNPVEQRRKARIARLKSSKKRIEAARAKERAMDAESEAEQAAQLALSNAATQEANASDAEADAREEAVRSETAEHAPADSSGADEAGAFVGAWTKHVKNPKAKKILKTAATNSPAGMQVRAGMKVVSLAQKGSPKAKKAIKATQAKAAKGDPQAKRDLNKLKAGKIAVDARKQAMKTEKKVKVVAKVKVARAAKVKAVQAKAESKVANRLAVGTRKRKFNQALKIQKACDKGNPKARAYVGKKIAAAKKGDRKAQTDVKLLQLAKKVNKATPNPRAKKNLALANKFNARLHSKNPQTRRKAERDLLILQAASKKGNPNASRALARLGIAAAVATTIAVGVVALPKKSSNMTQKQKVAAQKDAAAQKQAEKISSGLNSTDPAIRKKAALDLAYLRRRAKKGNKAAGKMIASIETSQKLKPQTQAEKDALWTKAETERDARLASQAQAQAKTPGAAPMASVTKEAPDYGALKQQIADAQRKLNMGTLSREEALSASVASNQLGDKKTAGDLALASTQLPSHTEELKKTAAVLASAEAGNATAKAKIDEALTKASAGDPVAIKEVGTMAGTKMVDDINKGRPVDPKMAEATKLVERGQNGDPAAVKEINRISEEATKPNPIPGSVAAAAAVVGAGVVIGSLANKPKAKEELMTKINPPIPAEKKSEAESRVAEIVSKANEGTITQTETREGIEIAQKLGKPKLAAEISAKAPPLDRVSTFPMSSLPDQPLPPITGWKSLIRESLKALTFSTPDPLVNYRDGLSARSTVAAPSIPALEKKG